MWTDGCCPEWSQRNSEIIAEHPRVAVNDDVAVGENGSTASAAAESAGTCAAADASEAPRASLAPSSAAPAQAANVSSGDKVLASRRVQRLMAAAAGAAVAVGLLFALRSRRR